MIAVAAERHGAAVEREAIERAAVLAASVDQQVQRTIDGINETLDLLEVWRALSSSGQEAASNVVAVHLRSATEHSRFGIIQLSLISADGWSEWTTTTGWQRIRVADLEHVRAHMEETIHDLFVSDPLIGRVSGRLSIQFSRAVRDQDGRLSAILAASVDPNYLSGMLARSQPLPLDVAWLFRLDGTLLARSRAQDAAGVPRLREGADLLAAIGARREGSLRTASAMASQSHFVAFKANSEAPIVIAVGLDAEAAMARHAHLRGFAMATAVACTALILAALALVVTRADRKRAVADLAEAHAARSETDRLLTGVPAVVYKGCWKPDEGFSLSFVSDNVRELTGWFVDLAREPDWWLTKVDPDSRPEREGFYSRVAKEGRSHSEYRFKRPDGQWIWIRDVARVSAERDDGFEIMGYWGDITIERTIAEQATERAKLATLGEMATGLAHELNQPLAVMSMAAENAISALDEDGLDGVDAAKARLSRITQQAQRAKDIVGHLRIFGRPDSGPPEPIDLRAAVDGTMILAGAALRNADIQVRVFIHEGTGLVMGRLVLVEQVLLNLCMNSRDVILERRPQDRLIEIIVPSDASPGMVSLVVRDTGGGIPEGILSKIFQPLFTTKAAGKGTGLGLSICQSIMRSLGGEISASNTERGAEFRLVFQAALSTSSEGGGSPLLQRLADGARYELDRF